MLEPQRMLRDAAAGRGLPSAVTASLRAHLLSPAEPSPTAGGPPEITDEDIDADTAACCRICLESESEPGEQPHQSTGGFLSAFFFVVASLRAKAIIGPRNMFELFASVLNC
jgi:hypothetical protein